MEETGDSDRIHLADANRREALHLIREAELGLEQLIVLGDQPVADGTGVERLKEWQQLQDDLIDITLVAARMMTDDGRRYSLDEVMERFGYTREELEAMPEDK